MHNSGDEGLDRFAASSVGGRDRKGALRAVSINDVRSPAIDPETIEAERVRTALLQSTSSV